MSAKFDFGLEHGGLRSAGVGRERSFVRSGRRFDPRPALRTRIRIRCACEEGVLPITKHESQALHDGRPSQFDTGYSLAVRCPRARCGPPLAPSPGRYGECIHVRSSGP
jgi:hypothetical protein